MVVILSRDFWTDFLVWFKGRLAAGVLGQYMGLSLKPGPTEVFLLIGFVGMGLEPVSIETSLKLGSIGADLALEWA